MISCLAWKLNSVFYEEEAVRAGQIFDQPFEDPLKPNRVLVCLKGNHTLLVLHHQDGRVDALGFVPFNSSATAADIRLTPEQEEESLEDRLSRDGRGHHTKVYLRRTGEFISNLAPLPFYRGNRKYARVARETQTYRDILRTRLERAQAIGQSIAGEIAEIEGRLEVDGADQELLQERLAILRGDCEYNTQKTREIQEAIDMGDRDLIIKYLTHPYSSDIYSVVVPVGFFTDEQIESLKGTLIRIDNEVRRRRTFTLSGVETNCAGLALRALGESGIADPLEVVRTVIAHDYYDPARYKGHLSIFGYYRLNVVCPRSSVLRAAVLQPSFWALQVPYVHLKSMFSTAVPRQQDDVEVPAIEGLEALPALAESQRYTARLSRGRSSSPEQDSPRECG